MDHEIAVKTNAALRYVNSQMSEAERDLFEDHYFGCPVCAAQVEAAVRLLERFVKLKSAFRILEVSLNLFTEEGYRKVMLREVASKASVTEGAIFRWYRSKLDLLKQAMRCKLLEATDPAELATDALGRLVPVDRKILERAVKEQVELVLSERLNRQ